MLENTHWKGIIGETNGVPNLGEIRKKTWDILNFKHQQNIKCGAIEKQRDSSPVRDRKKHSHQDEKLHVEAIREGIPKPISLCFTCH